MLILLIVSLLLLLPGTGVLPLMDRDEPRFARATVEMMQRGEWAVPYFNDEYRFDKPPLTYWWMSLNYFIGGITELTARLHSVISAFLTAIVIYFMGRRFFSPSAGFLAGIAWLASFQVLAHGRLAVADMPMVLSTALSCWAIYELLSAAQRPSRFGKWFWVLWLSQGLGFLAKTPVPQLTPLLALLLLRFLFWRKPLPWGNLQPLSGLFILAIFILGWGLPANLATDWEFAKIGLGYHVVERGTSSFHGRISFPFLCTIFAIVSLHPWLALSGQAYKTTRKDWDLKRAWLVCWFLAPQLIFAFYATQLPHYPMPGFPAFFLLIFQSGLFSLGKVEEGYPRRIFHGIHLLWAAVFLGAIALLVWLPLPSNVQPVKIPFITLLVMMLFLQSAALFLQRGIVPAFLAGLILVGMCLHFVAVDLKRMHPSLLVAAQLPGAQISQKKELNPEPVWMASEYEEPSLVFYAEGKWRMTSLKKAARRIEEHNPDAIVIQRRQWSLDDSFKAIFTQGLRGDDIPPSEDRRKKIDELISATGGRYQPAGEPIQGYNVARTAWTELIVLVREQE